MLLRHATLIISGLVIPLLIHPAVGASDWWRPAGRVTWDYQLTEPFSLDQDVAMFDLDLFETANRTLSHTSSHGASAPSVCGPWSMPLLPTALPSPQYAFESAVGPSHSLLSRLLFTRGLEE